MDFLNPLFEAIGWLLALFYSVIPNLGVAIILLTFTIMLILYPLTAKQAKSMIAMQRVQPEIKKLQAKYKNDRQKLNEEMMKFYKENKINPLAGCLAAPGPAADLLRAVPGAARPREVRPDGLERSTSALCTGPTGAQRDVDGLLPSSVNHLKFLGMDLQLSAVDAHNGALNAAPYFILVGLVILTGYHADPPGPEAHPGGQQADGHGHEGAAGVLRAHLAAASRRAWSCTSS